MDTESFTPRAAACFFRMGASRAETDATQKQRPAPMNDASYFTHVTQGTARARISPTSVGAVLLAEACSIDL